MSDSRYWVSVYSRLFCGLDLLFATLTRDGWNFSLLWYSSASMMLFFTVLNYPMTWWDFSNWRRFSWLQAVPHIVFPGFFFVLVSNLLQSAS